MNRKIKGNPSEDTFDLTALLHPAQAFARPMDVVIDHDLTLAEKRAILAAWASDACAVDANPTLRRGAGRSTACFDEIMDALRELDRLTEQYKPVPRYRRILEARRAAPRRRFTRGGDSGDRGAPMQ